MAKRNEFVEYVLNDLLLNLSGLSAKPMFGGFCIYNDGIIVGIVVEDELYLKVDDTNRVRYESFGSTPFAYTKKSGKSQSMSYWKIPSEVLGEREKLQSLVLDSYEINLKRAVEKETKKKTSTKFHHKVAPKKRVR